MKGLAALPLALGSAPLGGDQLSWLNTRPRRDRDNRFTVNGKNLLVAVEGADPRRMLRAGLQSLGGFEDAVADKKRIVIKPNATAAEPFPVTTSVELMEELVSSIQRVSEASIVVCDSPSYAGLSASRVFSKLGYYGLAQRGKVSVLCIDPVVGSDFVQVSHPSWRRHRSILTNRIVQDADFVINVAVPKRHHSADFTCALKNNFGCTYDTFRMRAHVALEAGGHEGPHAFDDALVEFADAVRPDLTIVDARDLLARSGPSFRPGESEIVRGVNRLILSGDMVAIDSYCGHLMERHDETFSTADRLADQLIYAERLGLGTREADRIQMVEVTE